MLADWGQPPASAGLRDGLHKPATQFMALIRFIAGLLPNWRDDPTRDATETAEDKLSEQLCDYLNAESRKQPGPDSFQFQRETRDETEKIRNLDIAAKPAGETINVSGRAYSHYDIFLPIECKRLPMPGGAKRDAREYVFDSHRSAGGIHRFKAGHHGAAHSVAAMIGYVQQDDIPGWKSQIDGWINGLVAAQTPDWSAADCLALEHHDAGQRFAALNSRHVRKGDLPDIALSHLWIEM